MILASGPNTSTRLIIEIGLEGVCGDMRKAAKPRKLREMIEAAENQLPRGALNDKLGADAPKRLLQGEAERMVGEICDSILHRLNQPEQPSRNQEHRRPKLDANPQ
jgi:hypothetical protein